MANSLDALSIHAKVIDTQSRTRARVYDACLFAYRKLNIVDEAKLAGAELRIEISFAVSNDGGTFR